MKAERRHQLQNNALAQQLETFPEMLKRNASKIMLVITAGLLTAFIVRYRMNAAEVRQVDLANAMLRIRQAPLALRRYDGMALRDNPAGMLAQARNQISHEADDAVETVLREADSDADASLRAEALVGRGDTYWALANLGELPGAATQPMLQPQRSAADYLKAAEEAYRDVIDKYSNFTLALTSAQMGLAAIAENRHDWAAAKDAYQAILLNKSIAPAFKAIASQRLDRLLPLIQEPIFLGTYPPAPAAPPAPTTSSMPMPATIPSTLPSSQPAH